MKLQNVDSVEQHDVEMEGSTGCKVQWLVGEKDGAPNFAMRQFEVEPGGHTPRHSHPYEHEIFVLEGAGQIIEDDKTHPLKKGDVVLVEPDEIHQFRNNGDQPLKFICLIPNSATGKKITVAPECGIDPDN